MSAGEARRGIAVVGSVNMDIVNLVEAFPQAGETITARQTSFHHGGKGANQSAAAAAVGAPVTFIGAVGMDSFAAPLVEGLAQRGVATESVARKETTSGQAFIAVNRVGENTIILSPGANGQVTAADVAAARDRIASAAALLTQNEIPWEATLAALELGRRAGAHTYWNPAPAFNPPDEALALVDTLIVNEVEAQMLSGLRVESPADAAAAARALLARGVGRVIVTLGARGCLAVAADGAVTTVSGYHVEVVDTTGAGDTFIGMFAAAALEMELVAALRFASAAAALSVTRPGARESIPTRAEVEAFLARQ